MLLPPPCSSVSTATFGRLQAAACNPLQSRLVGQQIRGQFEHHRARSPRGDMNGAAASFPCPGYIRAGFQQRFHHAVHHVSIEARQSATTDQIGLGIDRHPLPDTGCAQCRHAGRRFAAAAAWSLCLDPVPQHLKIGAARARAPFSEIICRFSSADRKAPPPVESTAALFSSSSRPITWLSFCRKKRLAVALEYLGNGHVGPRIRSRASLSRNGTSSRLPPAPDPRRSCLPPSCPP